MTQDISEAKRPCTVNWYRTPIDSKIMKQLHGRSDWLGLVQTLGYLGVIAITGAAAFWAAGRLPVPVVILLVFLYGMAVSFIPNAVHELGHGTVFETKFLNAFFLRILSFLGWHNFEMFGASHARHHRYTLHAPDDLEVVLPMRLMVKHFFKQGFLNPPGLRHAVRHSFRIARGRFCGDWELTLYPESDPGKRRPPMRWARTLLAGHALILIVSICFKLWLLPVLVTLGPFYGGWLFFLCNNTQHIGLQDNVPDFRLCCRTFTLNPVVEFLYWHMNYHTEHHMYAAVPCYRLGRLHQVIKHDMPPCPHGLIATWKEIAAIQKRQDEDPAYQFAAPLPGCPTV
jgi:fatty acid desaturase